MSSMVVNGAAILMAIAQTPEDLSFSEGQINELAMNALVTKIRDKDLKVDPLRKIAATIGSNDFKLALDHLPMKDVTALAKRLDAKNPELKTAGEAWIRGRISALILGGADPTPPPAKTKAPARSTGSKTGKALQSKALKPRAPRRPAATKEDAV